MVPSLPPVCKKHRQHSLRVSWVELGVTQCVFKVPPSLQKQRYPRRVEFSNGVKGKKPASQLETKSYVWPGLELSACSK